MPIPESVDGARHLNGANKPFKERVLRINDGEGDVPVDSSEIGGQRTEHEYRGLHPRPAEEVWTEEAMWNLGILSSLR